MSSAVAAGALMHAEILEQPGRWRDLIESQRDALTAAGDWLRADDYDSIVFVARGTSDHAAIYGAYLYQVELGRPAYLSAPSVSSVFGRTVFRPNNLVVAISQSGASPDLIATLEGAREAGARVISVTNNPLSPMAQLGDVHVDLSASPELSVAATKTYTAELVALFAMIRLAGGATFESVEQAIRQLEVSAELVLETAAGTVLELASTLKGATTALAIGRGMSMASAKESALKLMETSKLAASGWSAADAKHGPIGQIVAGTPVFLFTSSPNSAGSVLDLRGLLVSLGAHLFTIGGISVDPAIETLIVDLREAGVDDALLPVLEILPMQLLALNLSRARGLDPDKPVGLLKITTTV